MSDLRILDDAEIDLVSGGDSNYKYCPFGTTGGGPGGGLVPLYTECRTTPAYGPIGSAIVAAANAALHPK